VFNALKNLPGAIRRSPIRLALFAFGLLLILGGALIWSDIHQVLGGGAVMGVSASTKTTFAAFLKELYDGPEPTNVAIKNHAFFTLVPKKDKWVGDTWKVPVMFGNPMGRSRTFSKAQANVSASQSKAFKLDITKDYGVLTMDALAMAQSKGQAGAFAELKKSEYDGIIAELGNSISRSLFRKASGSIGRLKTGSATAVITLYNKTDTRHFQKDMVLVGSTADGGGAVKAGTVKVLSVQRQAGTVTLTGNYTAGIGTGADDDYLFVEGDYDLSIAGLAAWLPLTAPTGGDNHFGVDRSADPELLAGWRINNAARPIHENLIELGELIGTVSGGRPSHAFINHTKWTQMELELGDKVVRDPGMEAKVGFPSIKLFTSGGSFNVFAEPDCPEDRGYVLTMSSIMLRHLNPLPHVVDDDGNVEIRQSGDDGVEGRVRAWCNMAVFGPGRNGVCAL